ncbi:MAG: PfkB family carbohydrate kinase [Desulfobacterales bacterium]
MILVTGELLVDIFPDYKRIGGAPFNFAYHLKNFGMPVRFVSRLGRDAYGDEILSMLSRNRFDASDIQMDETHATGQVHVSFDRAGNPEFDIMADAAFDYIDFTPYQELPAKPVLVYFGTLIQRTEGGSARLQAFLDGLDPDVPCFYDINLRQGTHQPKVINHSLRKADIVKLNEDELDYIRREILQTDDRTEAGVFALMAQYNIDVLSLTRGSEGSELFIGDHEHFSVSATNVDPIVDTVGAGDAYAAVLALGYLRGWHPERILSHATMFSASICRIEGAVPEDTAFYQHMRNMIEGEANG